MKDLSTVYKLDETVLKSMTQAGYADYAARVIVQILGDTTLTKFEFYQSIHSSLPHLKHIVHDHKKNVMRFIFNEQVDMDITLHLYATTEDIDLPEAWEQEIDFSTIPDVPSKFAPAPTNWQGLHASFEEVGNGHT